MEKTNGEHPMGRPPRAPYRSTNDDLCPGLMLRSIAARMSHAAINRLDPRCDASRSMGPAPDGPGPSSSFETGARECADEGRRLIGVRPPQDEDGSAIGRLS